VRRRFESGGSRCGNVSLPAARRSDCSEPPSELRRDEAGLSVGREECGARCEADHERRKGRWEYKQYERCMCEFEVAVRSMIDEQPNPSTSYQTHLAGGLTADRRAYRVTIADWLLLYSYSFVL
jgi:hypothetical protein